MAKKGTPKSGLCSTCYPSSHTKNHTIICPNCGKERLVRQLGGRKSNLCKHCVSRKAVPTPDGTAEKPTVGDIRRGDEIGSSGISHYMWASCIHCGVPRWAILNTKLQPKAPRCSKCLKPMLGHHHTEEWKKQHSLDMKGRPYIETEARRKVYFKSGKNNPMYGKKLSKEECKKHSVPMEKNGRWQGGKSFEPYGTDFNKTLRKQVREQDNFTCQLCGISENGKRLCCHHIDYNKKHNYIENLVSLCDSCHSKTNFNRERWIKKLTLRTKRLENKNMEMVLHDIKYLIKGVHMLPDISDHNKVKRICDVLQETIDNLYADVLKMSKNPNKKGI